MHVKSSKENKTVKEFFGSRLQSWHKELWINNVRYDVLEVRYYFPEHGERLITVRVGRQGLVCAEHVLPRLWYTHGGIYDSRGVSWSGSRYSKKRERIANA